MEQKNTRKDFLRSLFETGSTYITTSEFLTWLEKRRAAVHVVVELIPFAKLDKWRLNENTGNVEHVSGRFFSIEGLNIRTNWGKISHWTQPIICQPEIGFLGIIAKKINGVLHFLMQSKIEPGNLNFVQISPTLQATKSNYTKVHQGKTPLYLEYFTGEKKVVTLLDQLQSEQGARFLRKRNRNIIVETEEDVELKEDFCWLTLRQIKELMRYPNLVNMDTRTVISGIDFGFSKNEMEINNVVINAPEKNQMFLSAIDQYQSHHSIEEIISWITRLKSTYELDVKNIPLRGVKDWIKTETEIHQKDFKYFSVIAANITISNREVMSWSQPLIRSAQEGIIAFIVKNIRGVLHFLVQAKVEAGNFDILELAPTVQCLTGNYRKGLNEYEVPFIEDILNAPVSSVMYKVMQSEEGGRFYQEQNLNMIVEVDEAFSTHVPANYIWMTLNQLHIFIKFNNYLNIQARSLLAAVPF